MSAIPLVLNVVCGTDWCPAGGREARVYLRLVALGVVEWPRLVCTGCGGEMARKDDSDEGEEMAKITAHGGPTDARANPPVPTEEPAELATVTEAEAEPDTPDVPAEQSGEAPTETETADPVPDEPPAPKRRGRPRKAA